MRLQEIMIQRADTQETGSRKLKYSRLCPSLLPKTQNINKQTNKHRRNQQKFREIHKERDYIFYCLMTKTFLFDFEILLVYLPYIYVL